MLKDTRPIVQEEVHRPSDFAKLTKLHELLSWALADLAFVERQPEYGVDMTTWMTIRDDNKCYVCLGGAVLANTFKFLPYDPWPMDDEFIALDQLRRGSVAGAWRALHSEPHPWNFIQHFRWSRTVKAMQTLNRGVTPYEVRKEVWWANMRNLEQDLIEAGV